MRAEWKCVTTAHMEQCVMTNGMYWMQQLSADSWDTTLQVCSMQSIESATKFE